MGMHNRMWAWSFWRSTCRTKSDTVEASPHKGGSYSSDVRVLLWRSASASDMATSSGNWPSRTSFCTRWRKGPLCEAPDSS
eukprot:scaffold148366_cov31-Tisochrysis_lutea.AAC.2